MTGKEIQKLIKDALQKQFGDDGFNTGVNGKRANKYDKTWILLARVKGGLYLAAESGTKPPTPAMLIRLEPNEILDK